MKTVFYDSTEINYEIGDTGDKEISIDAKNKKIILNKVGVLSDGAALSLFCLRDKLQEAWAKHHKELMNLMFPIIVQSTNSYVMNDGWELYNDDLLVLETELVAEIRAYYAHRKLEIPNFHEAMAFAHTEMSEVFEIYLAKKQWVRNNPQNKPTFSKDKLAEELGDAIMMLIVVGIVEDVDPIKALKNKIERKIKNGKT